MNAKIEKAWNLRNSRKLSEVEALVRVIESDLDKEANPADEHRWQVALLKASLLRAKGEREYSNQLLESLSTEIFAKQSRAPFQFYLQKALNFFAIDEFAVALEFFLMADSVAITPAHRLLALINVLTCLEGLNLPWSAVLQEVDELVSQVTSEQLEPVANQLEAFSKRQSFRQGKLDSIFFESNLQKDFSQAEYFTLWVSELPYSPLKNQNQDEEHDKSLQRLIRAQDFYAAKYRLQTLVADPRLEQKVNRDHPVEAFIQVDRIYLWTWRWLTNPTEATRANLAKAISSFDFSASIKKMTFEDFQMMRNALSWIVALQPSLRSSIESYLRKFTVLDCQPFPIFEYEQLCIDYFTTSLDDRDQTRILGQIKSHPVHKMKLGILAMTASILDKMSGPKEMINRAESISVDSSSFEIHLRNSTIVSRPVAKLLLSLRDKRVLSFSEALWSSFEIARFEQGIHDVKIHNLINRIKKLLPKSASIKTRELKIYWDAPKNSIIEIKARPLEKNLFENGFDFTGESKAHRSFAVPVHPRILVQKAGGKHKLKRSELQQLMNISKASTARWIEKWEKQGLIKSSGSGPSTSYHIDIVENNRLIEIS